MKRCFLLYCLLFVFYTYGQQPKEYKFINFSNKNGLSSNSINAIIKDKNGFMWFATEDGLNKFDGQNFIAYRHKAYDSTSIGRGAVIAMTQDKHKQLWLAANFTLSLYNQNQDAFFNYDFSKYGWITSLCADSFGKIWVGTYSGLFVFDPHTHNVTSFKANTGPQANTINCITEDSRHNIWIGSTNGLHLFHRKSATFKRYSHDPANPNSLSSNLIRCITEDTHGQLWIGTDTGGINVMNPSNGFCKIYRANIADNTSLSSNNIFKLAFDKAGQLWVGTDVGPNILHPQTNQVERIKCSLLGQDGHIARIAGRSVRDIYIDEAGIYWIAIHQGGVNKYDTNLTVFNHKPFHLFDPNGLTGSSVMTFAEDISGEIFVGLEGTGINKFNPKTGTIKPYTLKEDKINHASVIALASQNHNLWIATYQFGLYRVNTQTGAVNYFALPTSKNNLNDVPVNCISIDKNGLPWFGTNGGGVYLYHASKNTLVSLQDFFELPSSNKLPLNGYITSIIEDLQGNVWIGSNGTGIAVFSPYTKKFQVFNHGNSNLPIDKVQSVLCDKSGKIWIGLSGGGLCLYKPEKNNFDIFDERASLSNEVIYSILEDNRGQLWLSTNKGISTFDPRKKIFRNFSHYNGIQQSTFNVGAGLKTSDGQLFFGGLDGFNYFNPDNIIQKKIIPPLFITSLKVNNKLVSPAENAEITEHISVAKEITLNYKQNFSLDFMALNYTVPHENRYAYRLDGFDKEWNQANTAVYTNLDPGVYTFRLKAYSENGAWTTPEKVIKVTVKPPFWRTYYAYISYVLIVVFIFWALRRSSIQKLKNEFAREQERLEVKHLIEKERHEAEKMMELEKIKIKFLTNLSHELKTPLTLVLNPIENLMFQENSTEKLEMLNLISRNAKRLLNLVNQLLDFRSIETHELTLHTTEVDLVPFTQEIVDSFKYIATRKNISLHFLSTYCTFYTHFDKDKVERILINILSNAIKFTNEGGNVSVQLANDNNTGIKLIIRDTGIGLPPDLVDKIFERFFQVNHHDTILNQGSGIGLSIAQEFVKLHGGTINVESEEGLGTTFVISLPLLPIIFEEASAPSIATPENLSIASFAKHQPPKIDLPTILIVDDDDDLRTYLVESLKTKYKVIEATDGRKGWQKALSAHPQIIITDVNMPGVDGVEMVRKIKSDNRTKHIPVIMLTVLSEESNQLKGLEAGASDYLTKPFSFHLLSIKIDNLLSLNNLLKDTYSRKIQLETPVFEAVSEDEKFLLKFSHYVEEHIEDTNLSIEELSKNMCVSRGTLYSKILNLTGESPVEYVRSIKLKKALLLLEKSDMKISQIAYAVGFSNPNYFTRAFRAKYSVSPSEYVSHHKNVGHEVIEEES